MTVLSKGYEADDFKCDTGLPPVNAWTQFGKLRKVVVGKADPLSCHLPIEPGCKSSINDEFIASHLPWPGGSVKLEKSVQAAQAQLDNFAEVLEAECVTVQSMEGFDTELRRSVAKKKTLKLQAPSSKAEDARVVSKGKIETLRPETLDWSKPLKSPFWESPSSYCATCPRDTMITLGTTILEATMSKRCRYFESLACRDIALNLWRADPLRVRFLAAPKPSMRDEMYDPEFWTYTDEQRFQQMRSYKFCVNESEPVFDAADITRVGKDIFVQKSMTTNDSGIKWLTSHFPELRVHPVHFPYDLYPSHIDCTFVPLRPPSKDGGDGGLCLINPERPPLASEARLWRKNGWKFINAPYPAQLDRPPFSQSSYWLCMNLLSLSENVCVIEENEIPLYNILNEYGFDPVTVPMRHMYDFGGGIHCSTWDIQRDDSCKDYFPEQEFTAESLYKSVFTDSKFEDVEVVDVGVSNEGFVLNPMSGLATGTWMNAQQRDKEKAMSKSSHTHSHSASETSSDIFKRSGAGGSFKVKGDHSQTWGGKNGNTELTADTLRIDDQPVMESWETPYMHRLADVASEVGGDLLEIGFGLGLSGRRVQTHSNVKSHTVIEANDKVFASLQQFAKEEEAAGRPKVIPEHGLWVDVVDRLLEQGRKFDVILYDPYPQNESEQHLHQFLFINTAWELLKPGGRFVYCNLTSIGKLKESFDSWQDLWEKSQLPYLTRKPKLFKPENCTFSLFEFDQATKTARGNCEYYMHDHALVPVCTK